MKPLSILIVNEDKGPVGTQLVAGLKASGGFNVETKWDGVALWRFSWD